MAPTPVATCFLRNRTEVLLLRRSDAVDSYRGRWGAVSGHVASAGAASDDADRGPLATAREEIAEETGLLPACDLVRAGDPVEVEDDGRTWDVYPFLFDCDSRAVTTNEETDELAWVPPTEILRRETVPGLWSSYDRVRPTVATVRRDREHGSAVLSLRALEVLRDRAGELAAGIADRGDGRTADDIRADDPRSALAVLSRDLLDARPGMAALRNRVARAMVDAEEDGGTTPAAVEASARAAIERALDADEGAAGVAAEHVRGDRVLTLSRSGTVLAALRRADPAAALVAESRPGCEGVAVAESLAGEGVDVTLVADAAVAHHLATADVDTVLVGADTVLADGSVVNKVGTRAAALAAASEGVPVYAVAARDKVGPDADAAAVDLESADLADVYDGAAELRVETPLFDVTPGDLVDAVLTEAGPLSGADVKQVADEHRRVIEAVGDIAADSQ